MNTSRTPRLLPLSFACLVSPCVATAQYTEGWVATQPFPYTTGPNSFAFSDGGLTAVAMHDVVSSALVVDLYDSAGGLVWSHTLPNVTSSTFPPVVAVNAGGEVAAAAAIPAGFAFDTLVARFDAAGNPTWVRIHDSPGLNSLDSPVEVAMGLNGDVYVCGTGKSAANTYDLSLLRYDVSGSLVWSTFVNGSAQQGDASRAFVLDGTGGAVVCGVANSNSSGTDQIVAHVDANGSIAWTREFSNSAAGNESAVSVALDASGNAFVSGNLITAGASVSSLFALDPTGNVLWSRTAARSDPSVW